MGATRLSSELSRRGSEWAVCLGWPSRAAIAEGWLELATTLPEISRILSIMLHPDKLHPGVAAQDFLRHCLADQELRECRILGR